MVLELPSPHWNSSVHLQNSSFKIAGKGDIEGETSKGIKITLKDVQFVPEISGQLISVKSIESALGRLKHLDIKVKLIREEMLNKEIANKYISSKKTQIADILTKALTKVKLYSMLNLLVFSVINRQVNKKKETV